MENGRLRRYYRLTDAGAAAVAAETQRMTTQARAAERRLALRARPSAPGPGRSDDPVGAGGAAGTAR